MRNIWTYQTQANGLLSNAVIAVVHGEGQDVYAATNGGISVLGALGEQWMPAVIHQSEKYDISINQASGLLLFRTGDCSGLGVQRSPGGDVHFLTREHDGLASNCVSWVTIDQAAALVANDELGPAVVSHYGVNPEDQRLSRTLSIYKVETGKWRVVQLPDGFNILHIRFFSGKIYACTEGGLAISADGGEHWTYKKTFSAPIRLPRFDDDVSGSQVNDIYIDADGSWYILCQSDQSTWLLKSSDGGQSFEVLLSTVFDVFRTIEASADNLFILSENRLRVFNTREQSIRIFRGTNGLGLGPQAGHSLGRFVVQDGGVFVPTDIGVAVATAADIAAYPRLWQYATTERGLPDNAVRCVTGSSYQTGVPVLVGTRSGLAASTDGGQSWKGLGGVAALPPAGTQINDLCYCPTPTAPFYGIATEDAGFFICGNPLLPGVSVSQYTTQDGLASNRVVCAFARIYNSTQAWLGHDGEGLSSYVDGKWRIANRDSGLAGNHVLSIRPGWYKGKARLYACGYDKDPASAEESAALSFSEDNGKTWVAVKALSWAMGTPYRLFDVWSVGHSSDVLYGLICNKESFDIWLGQSSDGGASWDAALSAKLDTFTQQGGPAPGSTPKIYADNRGQFISLPNGIFTVNSPSMNVLECVYWEDGLLQGNSGSAFIDADGWIYQGNRSCGLGVSNVAYMPFYDWVFYS